ncbi:MAG: LysR family transcriptional regulator, partial [Pseudomonadota bacterium]
MSRTDLNLMVIFDAIMKEQSITAAAEQLAMTQPSVSNAIDDASATRHWKPKAA